MALNLDPLNGSLFNQPMAQLYDLGYHVASGRLVRIPSKRITGCIPPGCVRVVRLREAIRNIVGETWGQWYSPYEADGTLSPVYGTIPTWDFVANHECYEGATWQGVTPPASKATLEDAYYDAELGDFRVPEGITPNPRYVAFDYGGRPGFVDLKLFADCIVARRFPDEPPSPRERELTREHTVEEKRERRQSSGSCDCPAGFGKPCHTSELECRVRAYQNGRLSVRSWFRKMRAADFERDVYRVHGNLLPVRINGVEVTDDRWTLFDTLKIVDSETEATYFTAWYRHGV